MGLTPSRDQVGPQKAINSDIRRQPIFRAPPPEVRNAVVARKDRHIQQSAAMITGCLPHLAVAVIGSAITVAGVRSAAWPARHYRMIP
jgi:hypothetical protein